MKNRTARHSLMFLEPSKNNMIGRLLSTLRLWIKAFFDPVHFIRATLALPWYFSCLKKYRSLSGHQPFHLMDLQPKLQDRTAKTPFDSHYFWMCGWAMRRITKTSPKFHADIGSHNLFINLLSSIVPTVFLDYRPLEVRLPGLNVLAGDILHLPFADNSLPSLSCLHVAEHIGLGRYGDPLNPLGTEMACKELARVLAPKGFLFFAIPVGKERTCFNAHRIFDPLHVVTLFSSLKLLELSGVDDDGQYHEDIDCYKLASSKYACGFYWFQKPSGKAADLMSDQADLIHGAVESADG
jgi:hypothetical protein